MRVLYVAPRYHTNQTLVMKGWLEHGHQVRFLSQFAGTSEDYTVLQPVILGYSGLFEGVMRIYRFFFCRKEKSATREFDLRIKIGFPPIGRAKKQLQEFQPDLVIVRERSVYNIPFARICKKKRIPCVLYNQSPLWDKPDRDKGWKKKFLLALSPKIRMTPVMGTTGNGNVKTSNSYFVPFVTEPHCSPEEKLHFQNEKIQLLCVGRYEERKNLFLLLNAVKELIGKYKLHLTIIGEAIDQNQMEYYEKLKKQILAYHLEQQVTLLQNFNMEQMYEEYRKADLFVLPSTRERASIAQLEAMSCSLPVICSDTNGSACYVEEGVNGWLFADNKESDLREKIEKSVCDRSRLLRMGQESYRIVQEKYCFINYYKEIMKCKEGCTL